MSSTADNSGPPPGSASAGPSRTSAGGGRAGGESSMQVQQLPQPEMPQLFSLRRPCHAGSGLSSGLKSLAKGVGLGLGCLLVAPVAGAMEDGVKGFAGGLVRGVVGGVVLPVAGVVVAGTQIVRGVARTPLAIHSAVHGRHWDNYERQWVDYDPKMAIVLDNNNSSNNSSNNNAAGENAAAAAAENAEAAETGGQNATTDYYALLGVPKTATDEEIRRQYYRRARELHPDKNPDNPKAQAQFQKLGEAYQVLSTPQLRQIYDRDGTLDMSAAGEELVDNSLFFNMLFGSDKFEPLVGQLAMATAANLGENVTEKEMRRAELRRICVLAVALQQRLDGGLAANDELAAFRQQARQQAEALVKASFGDRMLLCVGQAYRNGAKVALGGFGSVAARLQASTQSLKMQLGLVRSMLGVHMAQKRVERRLLAEEYAAAVARAEQRYDENYPRDFHEETTEDGYVLLVRNTDAAPGKEAEQGENSGENHDGRTVAAEGSTAAAAAATGAPKAQEVKDVGAAAASDRQTPADTERQTAQASSTPSAATATGAAAATSAPAATSTAADSQDKSAADTPKPANDEGEAEGQGEEGFDEEDFMERIQAQVQQETMPQMMRIMWEINATDITQTLHKVTSIATRGGSHGLEKASSAVRKARGTALLVLADTFVEVALQALAAAEAAHVTEEDRMERAAQAAAVAHSARYFGEDIDVDEFVERQRREAAAAEAADSEA